MKADFVEFKHDEILLFLKQVSNSVVDPWLSFSDLWFELLTCISFGKDLEIVREVLARLYYFLSLSFCALRDVLDRYL